MFKVLRNEENLRATEVDGAIKNLEAPKDSIKLIYVDLGVHRPQQIRDVMSRFLDGKIDKKAAAEELGALRNNPNVKVPDFSDQIPQHLDRRGTGRILEEREQGVRREFAAAGIEPYKSAADMRSKGIDGAIECLSKDRETIRLVGFDLGHTPWQIRAVLSELLDGKIGMKDATEKLNALRSVDEVRNYDFSIRPDSAAGVGVQIDPKNPPILPPVLAEMSMSWRELQRIGEPTANEADQAAREAAAMNRFPKVEALALPPKKN